MKLEQINYQPLLEMKSARKQALQNIMGGKLRTTLLIIIGVAVIGLVVVSRLAFLQPVILVVVGFSFLYTRALKQVQDFIWQNFAKANKWQLFPPNLDLVPPGLKDKGHSERMSPVMAATFDNHIVDVFTHSFTVGHGKNSRKYFFTIARVRLNNRLPHIVLDSKKNKYSLRKYDGYTTCKLEGDFDKYFSVHFPEGQHINALSIISPDVMQTLINHNLEQDIELYGDSLFFINANDSRTHEQTSKLFTAVNYLADEIVHRAETYRAS